MRQQRGPRVSSRDATARGLIAIRGLNIFEIAKRKSAARNFRDIRRRWVRHSCHIEWENLRESDYSSFKAKQERLFF